MLDELKIAPTTMPCKNSADPVICNSKADVDSSLPATIVVVGHVDHGKSTLLGRLSMDSGQAAANRISHVQSICAEKGVIFEPAFLLDAFEEEQNQGISIDSTRLHFAYDNQKYLFIDAPGHHEFIKNMTSAASYAKCGILVIDSIEGIRAQTNNHLKILSMLGITHILVAINKMDKVNFDSQAFVELSDKTTTLLNSLNLACPFIVPIAALTGENLFSVSDKMPWYFGNSLVGSLPDLCKLTSQPKRATQFRMLLQDVYKFDDTRYFAGRVTSGQIRPGDTVLFSPSGKVSGVEAVIVYPEEKKLVGKSGDCIALTLSEQIFVERGEIISLPEQAPEVESQFLASIVWLAEDPLDQEANYLLKLGTAQTKCSVCVLDSHSLISRGEIASVLIKTTMPISFDRSNFLDGINKFVLCSQKETTAAGIIADQLMPSVSKPKASQNVRQESGYLERSQHEEAHGHKGAVLWLTGLSGSGKSTIAKTLERELFDRGYRALVLDADNLRRGLCADLGFSKEDRSENIRRIAEVAKISLHLGLIVIVACLSPYANDRQLARTIIGDEDFLEVFVSCPLAVCKGRDPKGLYKKLAEGTITLFSGFDSPYQMPSKPNLIIESHQMKVDEEVDLLLGLLTNKQIIQASDKDRFVSG